jgi:parallel beta-helix repeat protein
VCFTLGVLGSKCRLMFGSPFRLVAVVLAVLVGLVAGCSADQGEAFDVAVAATVEAVQAEVPTVGPAVVEPTVVPTLEPVPTVSVTYDGVYAIELDGSGDYATIEEALEQVTNGAELRLGAGTFQVTAPLVIDKDIVLTGAGQNSTTITMGGTNDLIISVTEAEVTITDLTTDGGFGVNVNESEIDIQRVTFQRSSLDGLTISNSVGTVTDSISQDNAVGGFSWAGETSGVASNNTAQNNQGHGFALSGTGDMELTGNTSNANAGAGFVWYGQTSGVVSNNTAQNNQGIGFSMSGSALLELTGNTSKDNGRSGFVWWEQASGVASNNTAQNNQGIGFEIGWSAALELTGNTSKDNAGAGFAWYDEASGVASNNTAQNNQYKAFDNQSSGDLELWNNNEE